MTDVRASDQSQGMLVAPRIAFGFGLALITSAAACGGSVEGGRFATLEASVSGRPVAPGGHIVVSSTGVTPGDEAAVATLRIIDSGEASLVIDELSIESSPPGAFRLIVNAEADAAGRLTIVPQGQDGLEALAVDMLLRAPSAGVAPSAVIHIRSNHVDDSGTKRPEIRFDVTVESGVPALRAVPSPLDLGAVSAGGSAHEALSLLNPGNGKLTISGFSLDGNAGFSLDIGEQHWDVSSDTHDGITLDEPLVILPGDSASLLVHYVPTGPEEARATLTLASDDPTAPDGTIVPISANVAGPVLLVRPPKVDFGGKFVGRLATVQVTLESAGGQALEIGGVELLPSDLPGAVGGDDFAIDLASLLAHDPDGIFPITLAPNDHVTFDVTYTPAAVSELDDEGAPVRDQALVRVRSNAYAAATDVPLSGFGADPACPVPVITIAEGEEVVPQTELHLDGSGSMAGSGSITAWHWRVRQPNGSFSTFSPGPDTSNPTFEANVSGTYEFQLDVEDSAGNSSCAPAARTVQVVAETALHIELLWTTPNDPDPTNTGPVAGADLDLHFTHTFASTPYDLDHDGADDPWYDTHFDCFWFNKNPDWTTFRGGGIGGNPHLDRDDTDGAGPENLNLDAPEDGRCYRVAVHYWSDHDFGRSDAVVRFWVHGILAYETPSITLTNHDLWDVTEVCWPPDGSGIHMRQTCDDDASVECAPVITPGYIHPSLPIDE